MNRGTKRKNIHIMRIPKRKEKDKIKEILFQKIMAENFPKLERYCLSRRGSSKILKDTQLKGKRTKTNDNQALKIQKEIILKIARDKTVFTFKKILVKLYADFLAEIFQAMRK